MKSWIQRISEGEQRGHCTRFDRTASGNWITCACGSQDKRIPRQHGSGSPLDDKLFDLGLMFHGAICMNDFKEARITLERIENRVGEILREQEL